MKTHLAEVLIAVILALVGAAVIIVVPVVLVVAIAAVLFLLLFALPNTSSRPGAGKAARAKSTSGGISQASELSNARKHASREATGTTSTAKEWTIVSVSQARV